MYDLVTFTQSDVAACGSALRNLTAAASSMEDSANRIVRHLYDQLGDKKSGTKSCALVRFYKTHPYGELEPQLQEFARGILGREPDSREIKCLTLLATAGDKAEWNSRAKSIGHKAIPLPSEKVVEQIPMISQLVKQFGLEISSVLKPAPDLLVDMQQRTYNVFYLPDAVGSLYIPAQRDFVIPVGIQSVLGFGGILPSGNLFAVILFSKARIPRETADAFRSLAQDVKTAVQPFDGKAIFGSVAGA